MHPEDVRLMEHMALSTPLSLEEFCAIAQRVLELPAFELNAENETEWGIAGKDGVEYNVCRPFTDGRLKDWDATCPEGSNFGLILAFPRSSSATPETSEPVVSAVASKLAAAFATPVVHHRTWLGPETSLARSAKYQPAAG
jgi:hypothetical protein